MIRGRVVDDLQVSVGRICGLGGEILVVWPVGMEDFTPGKSQGAEIPTRTDPITWQRSCQLRGSEPRKTAEEPFFL